MLFVYKGTKSLRLAILGPHFGVSANSVAPKICVARAMKAYLARTQHCKHNDRVWCCTRPCKGVYSSVRENGDTLRHWMRRIMTRCGGGPQVHQRVNPASSLFQGHRRRLGSCCCAQDGYVKVICHFEPVLQSVSALDSTWPHNPCCWLSHCTVHPAGG